MQNAFPHLSIQSEDTTQTLVLSIRGASYRSSDEVQLLALRRELEAVAEQMESAHNVIVELASVAVFGSSFLRLVFDALAPLRSLGVRAILCGDRHGLVVLTAIERWINVFDTLEEALDLATEFNPRHDQARAATRHNLVEFVA